TCERIEFALLEGVKPPCTVYTSDGSIPATSILRLSSAYRHQDRSARLHLGDVTREDEGRRVLLDDDRGPVDPVSSAEGRPFEDRRRLDPVGEVVRLHLDGRGPPAFSFEPARPRGDDGAFAPHPHRRDFDRLFGVGVTVHL